MEDLEKKFQAKRVRTLKKLEEERDHALKLSREDREGPDFKHFRDELIRSNTHVHTMATTLVEESEAEMLRKVFDRRQKDRLSQIRLQAEGPSAFNRSEVQESLGLDSDQIAEIRTIRIEGERNLSRAATLAPGLAHPRPGSEETVESKNYEKAAKNARNDVASIRVATMRTIAQVLSKAQRVKYQKMIGEPFDFLGKLTAGSDKKGLNEGEQKGVLSDKSSR